MSKKDFNSRLTKEEIDEYQADSFRQFLKELLPEHSDVKDVFYSEQRQVWFVDYWEQELHSEHNSFLELVFSLLQKGTFNTDELKLNITPFAL